MNFLKKLFSKSKLSKQYDNKILLLLLNQYSTDPSDKNYSAVITELMNGAAFLLTPSVNDGNVTTDWQMVSKGTTIKLSGIYDLDGLKAMAVFTDEATLYNWAKEPREYIALGMGPIIDICKDLGIARLVINSDQPTMFVLQRNLENLTPHVITKETPVQIGTPKRPLNQKIINKLIKNFEKVSTIIEAYQYAQTMNGEFSIVLGIRLSSVSENSRLAVNAAITNAIENEKLDQPLDSMILETDDWLQTVRGVSGSLFYKSD